MPWTDRSQVSETKRSAFDRKGLLQAQSEVLALVGAGQPLSAVLTRLVLAIEARSHSPYGSILLFDEAESRVWVGAAPSLPSAFSSAIDGLQVTASTGSCGAALHYRQRVVTTDIARDPLWRPFRELAHESRLAACVSVPILDASERPIGTFAFYYAEPTQPDAHDLELIDASSDIARVAIEHHRQQEELRRSRRDLERRVRERIDDLEAFVSSITQDLRGPLADLESRLATLERGPARELPDAVRAEIETSLATARSMTRVVDDLLELSLASRQPLGRGGVEPRPLVDAAIAAHASDLADRDVEITIGPLPACRADARLLARVFQNLIGNALKYTRKRSVGRISIEGVREGGEVHYTVRDNGIGFDMRHADEIFGAFARLDPRGEYEGSGIGLALVRRIVDRHDGRVWAESRPGEGAVFHLHLEADPREGT